MKKTEQQLADELDALLTARMKGQELPASEDLSAAERKLAAELIDLAEATGSDPVFDVRLERRLGRIAAAQAATGKKTREKTDPPEGLTFWQELSNSLWRSLTMKRTVIAIGAVAAVFIFAFFAWAAFNNRGQGEDRPTVADATVQASDDEATVVEDTADTIDTTDTAGSTGEEDTSDETTEPAGPTELAMLPRMDSSQSGGGLGGGGGEGAPAPAATESIMIAPDFGQAFAEATYVLNTTLPVEPTTALVHQRVYGELDVALARTVADKFGFNGPLYLEIINYEPRPLPVEEPLPEASSDEEEGVGIDRPVKDEPVEFEPPKNYHAFDGERVLNIYNEGVSYINLSVRLDYQEEVANAVPIAEAYLQELGLLTFPYVAEEGFSNGEVLIKRLVDGQPLQEPDMYVQVASNGEIAFASSFQLFSQLVGLGEYPLISAEAAWQLVLDDVIGNNIGFSVMPDEDRLPRPRLIEPPAGMPQYWRRQYQPGSEAHLYTWPVAFERVDSEGAPLVRAEDFVLLGNEADLRAIADQVGQMFHFWGQIGADNTMQLAGWEVMGEPEPLTLEGNVQRTADQVLLNSSEGQTYIIPDAPADLPDGMKVNLFAWNSRDAGLAYPVLDWQNIDEWFDYSEEPVVLPEPVVTDEEFVDPFSFTEITINEVELAYQTVFNFENIDKMTRPDESVQPVWLFSGVTDLGDSIELRVQAVSRDYIQTP